jgi:hypothetical protein
MTMAHAEAAVFKVFVSFMPLVDIAYLRGEGENQMHNLCWLNHLWATAYEFGDTSFAEQLAFIEEAHKALGSYFKSCPSWAKYISAYCDLLDGM